MTSAQALTVLRASRDAEHDAPIFDDDGQTVAELARTAGVSVVYASVNLSELEIEYRTINAKEKVPA